MQIRTGLLCMLTLAATAGATSLQKLSLDDMIQKSTGVVRGKVTSSYVGSIRGNLYTYYRVQVLEAWKASNNGMIDIAVPGGASGGKRQVVEGAPVLATGQEYVVFYWTSKTGLTQVLGLTQGLFAETDNTANPMFVRRASGEPIFDQYGKPTQDESLSMRASDLRARVKSGLSKGAAK
jgi:hypothetical protein